MIAKFEKRPDFKYEKIWLTTWKNLKNTPHYHDEAEIIFCKSGICHIETETGNFDLNENQCAFIEGGKIHKIESENQSITVIIMIDSNTISNIVSKKHIGEKLENTYDIMSFYNSMKTELKEKRDFYSDIIESSITLFVSNIFRTEKQIENYSLMNKTNKHYSLLKEVLKQMELNYQYITFNDFCKKFGYSPSHFSRLFKEITGTTFTKYMNSIKIEHAAELLKSDKNMSVIEISNLCGFDSIRNFNRNFLNLTGYTPTTLPDDFKFSSNSIKIYGKSENPTEKQSIQLD